jgi:pimeloyl-ACP methyl ester carboxylesterase
MMIRSVFGHGRARRLAHWASLLPVLALCGCLRWFPAPTPMRSAQWMQPPAWPRARCLVVFLPGMGDHAEDFDGHGFVAEVKRHAPAVDVVAADATIGYYARGTFPERLATDVIRPARARGYEQVWLIGVSMGGLGTIWYSRAHTADVTGVLALAPYLGEREIIDEIYAQGGLARWKGPPRVDALNEDSYQREIWRWLQAVTGGRERGPIIYIGYGRADDLARPDALLAARLPRGHTYRIDGAHDWTTWKILLGQFLESSDFAARCGARGRAGAHR